MMKYLSILAALLWLAACAAPPPPAVTATARIEAGWLGIRVSAPAPLDQAELTAPDGRAFAARRIQAPGVAVRTEEVVGRPSVLIGGSGGSSSGLDAGIGLSIPLKNPFGGGERQRAYVSQADFELPAEALESYRDSNGQGWALLIQFGNSSRSLAAPPLAP